MNHNIFIPKTITVGYQERSGTYTGKLAYVIYTDEKGVLRKKKSWESWRSTKIEPTEHENQPTEGFVLNKKAGGNRSHWNTRQTYTRVYDPRGFEFEITVPNLLYILENTNSIKGKGLEGEFVYGWSGTEIILIPTSAPDYEDIQKRNDILFNKEHIKAKDLVLGGSYKNRQGDTLVYLGKYDYYDPYYKKCKGKYHFFYENDSYFSYKKSLGNTIIECISESCVENYSDLMDKLETQCTYSPIDPSKDEYILYTLSKLKSNIKKSYYYSNNIYLKKGSDWIQVSMHSRPFYSLKEYHSYCGSSLTKQYNSLEELFSDNKIYYKQRYLANGKPYQEN